MRLNVPAIHPGGRSPSSPHQVIVTRAGQIHQTDRLVFTVEMAPEHRLVRMLVPMAANRPRLPCPPLHLGHREPDFAIRRRGFASRHRFTSDSDEPGEIGRSHGGLRRRGGHRIDEGRRHGGPPMPPARPARNPRIGRIVYHPRVRLSVAIGQDYFAQARGLDWIGPDLYQATGDRDRDLARLACSTDLMRSAAEATGAGFVISETQGGPHERAWPNSFAGEAFGPDYLEASARVYAERGAQQVWWFLWRPTLGGQELGMTSKCSFSEVGSSHPASPYHQGMIPSSSAR